MGRHSLYLSLVMTTSPPGLTHQTGRKKGAARGSEGREVLEVGREAGCWEWETRSARSEERCCQIGQEQRRPAKSEIGLRGRLTFSIRDRTVWSSSGQAE
jgi:hypothetical protein